MQRRVKSLQVIPKRRHKPHLRRHVLPLLIVFHARQCQFPFRSRHLRLPCAEHRPPSVAAVETQQRHHFLQHPVVLHRPPSLYLGVEHALQPRPEQPHRRRIRPAMAHLFRCDGCIDFGHSFLGNIALPYVYHFQFRPVSTRRRFCRRREFPYPLDVFPAVQADHFPLRYLSWRLQSSALQRVSSLSIVKGNARFPHIQSMWNAFVDITLPAGSNGTRMVFFAKCHISFTYLIAAGCISDGWMMLYQGMVDWSSMNLCSSASCQLFPTTGSHTNS
ncbi:hypothetical protein LINGRAHAP2_LOCUS21080 [Linum grandiflorum]